MKKNILIIGSLNMDLIMHVNHIPIAGETILGSDVHEVCGGKGANQAYAAGRLNGDVKMLGAIGNDEAGEKILANLASAGVDTTDIIISSYLKTGCANILINEAGDNSIIVSPGANKLVSVDYIKEHKDAIKNADIVLLSMEIPQNAVEYAIELAFEYKKICILNPAPAPEMIKDNILNKISIIIPNETELEKLAGMGITPLGSVMEGCNSLLTKGVGKIIVTLGNKGAMLYSKETKEHYPARKVKTVDTTAAGDTFNAAVAVYLSEDKPLEDAIRFANLAASIVVQREGAQTSIPSREMVESIR